MSRDIALWKDPNGLTEDERRLVKRNLGFFVTADSLAANNIVLGPTATSRHPSAGSTCCARRSRRRSTPTPTSTFVESLDLDQGEVFNAYHEIASIREKDEFLVPFIDTLTDPAFVTGTPQNDQALLRSLIVFSCLMEGMFFYVGFTQILSLGRQKQDDRGRRAVHVHPARRVDALQFRHSVLETPRAAETARRSLRGTAASTGAGSRADLVHQVDAEIAVHRLVAQDVHVLLRRPRSSCSDARATGSG